MNKISLIKKRKQSNVHEKHKQSLPSEKYSRTFHYKSIKNRPMVFLRFRYSICVRCSILILLIKTVRCSIRSL